MEALGDGKFLEDKFCKQWNQQNALNEGMHQVGPPVPLQRATGLLRLPVPLLR
jgi:hypothetical protein